MKSKIKPMLAHPSCPFSSENFLFEVKWDGTRTLAFVGENYFRLQNRRLLNITHRYPELRRITSNVKAKEVILDGEIVVFEGGKPNFRKLQEREHVDEELRIKLLSELNPASYVVFDILYLDGKDTIELPLVERKRILQEVVEEGGHLLISPYALSCGERFFEHVKAQGLEGVVAKELSSKYEIGRRSKAWLKIKRLRTMDCVILGWTKGLGKREGHFGSLVLGAYAKGKLVHVGQVGTGFDELEMERVMRLLKPLRKEKPVFEDAGIKREVCWVEPKYVCEVEFMELTPDVKLRAPSFKRLRLDKEPEECELEVS